MRCEQCNRDIEYAPTHYLDEANCIECDPKRGYPLKPITRNLETCCGEETYTVFDNGLELVLCMSCDTILSSQATKEAQDEHAQEALKDTIEDAEELIQQLEGEIQKIRASLCDEDVRPNGTQAINTAQRLLDDLKPHITKIRSLEELTATET